MACAGCQQRRERLSAAAKSGSVKQIASAVAYSARTMAEDAGRKLIRQGVKK